MAYVHVSKTPNITVHFVVKDIEPLTLNIEDNDSFESIRQRCINHAQSKVCKDQNDFAGPLYAEAFGLRVHQNLTKKESKEDMTEVWVPQWYQFSSGISTDYDFRVRFRPSTLSYKSDNFLGQYLYLQVKNDFLLGTYWKRLETNQSLLGLLAVALFLPDSLPLHVDNCINKEMSIPSPLMKSYALDSMVSENILNRLKCSNWPIWKQIDKYYLCQHLTKKFKQYTENDASLSDYMEKLYEKLILEYPDYCIEEYDVKDADLNRDVTVKLRLYMNDRKDGLYYGDVSVLKFFIVFL